MYQLQARGRTKQTEQCRFCITVNFFREIAANVWSLQFAFKHKSKFHLAHHVSKRRDSTRSMCQAHAFWLCRACQMAWLDTLDMTSVTLNLVCCVICIKLWYESYSLIYWSMHLFIFSFDETNTICKRKSTNDETVQTSTIACSSSAMLEQHGSTRSTRQTCCVEMWRANLGYIRDLAKMRPH